MYVYIEGLRIIDNECKNGDSEALPGPPRPWLALDATMARWPPDTLISSFTYIAPASCFLEFRFRVSGLGFRA